MQRKIGFTKSSHSEEVMRKSLYWLPEGCRWEFSESPTEWCVTISADDQVEIYIADLNRRINDFKLRELLDFKTKNLRIRLIQSALERIAGED